MSLFLFTNLTMASAENDPELASLVKVREENARCLRCHGAEGFKTNFSGDIVSLYVNGKDFQASIHESLSCLTCHKGMTDYPHAKTDSKQSFKQTLNQNCQYCHEDVNAVYKNSIHGKRLAEGKKTALCSDCHGAHNVFKKDDPRSQVFATNQVDACTRCHEEKKESYNWGIHGKTVALGSKEKTATCSACHTSHDILGPDDPASTVADQNIPQTCSQCHVGANANFANGLEHYTLTSEGENAPMYYTYKFFSVILVATVALFVIYIEMDLYRRIRNTSKKTNL